MTGKGFVPKTVGIQIPSIDSGYRSYGGKGKKL